MIKKPEKTKLTETLKTLVRTEFVQGVQLENGEIEHYSIEDLIKKHNLASATLYRASRSEGWKVLRDQYNQEFQEKLNAERQNLITKESVKWDDDIFQSAKELRKQAMYYLTINNEAMEAKSKPFQPSQFLAITNALLTAQKLGKIALGEITENINVNSTIKEAEGFREIMELLDGVKTERLNSDSDSLH